MMGGEWIGCAYAELIVLPWIKGPEYHMCWISNFNRKSVKVFGTFFFFIYFTTAAAIINEQKDRGATGTVLLTTNKTYFSAFVQSYETLEASYDSFVCFLIQHTVTVSVMLWWLISPKGHKMIMIINYKLYYKCNLQPIMSLLSEGDACDGPVSAVFSRLWCSATFRLNQSKFDWSRITMRRKM